MNLKAILLMLTIVVINRGYGQNMSNPSFDSIYIGGIDRVYEWITSDGFVLNAGQTADTVHALVPNTIYDATGFQFSELTYQVNLLATPFSPVGLRLANDPDLRDDNNEYFETFIVNGNQFKTDNDGYIDLKSCGTPFAYRPLKIKGKYKFEDSLSPVQNYGKCIVLLKKYNSLTQSIDTIAYNFETTPFFETNTWASFEIPLNYVSSAVPDSIVVAFFSSVELNSTSALFYIDDLTFEYGPLGVDLKMKEYQISVYPNPTNGIIYIDQYASEFTNFKIWSTDGKLLEAGIFSKIINLEKFDNQFFILQVSDENGNSRSFKITKL